METAFAEALPILTEAAENGLRLPGADRFVTDSPPGAAGRAGRDDYTVQTRDGVTTVRYDAGGGEGTDTLVNIAALMFADGLLYL